ncbi:SPFH domain-containing protein [Gordonia sp. (in: high G+C Gram-positive bacteria)]|jgi:membrane protease subunit (stomatin/prohibitin family)|uniref:SPFH domain-containing protein n=1 Tax=Gordonia sp. (in: high G+C Gram-positive bacteria) TaxID=84139 RepID=UPI001D52B116|nr:SPFH domain-containing protein [Gordonia sp. (in: high G+C Gram-positive bacteria)]MCB1296806.1 SPFH domain-containing protein [Gordonia sp. (in: high G+C Gram-positive bacteria)]HMS76385.1 SPFH domain-containing protein [Gordonia sp. (in: high G+C Gram-positive bacteria)]
MGVISKLKGELVDIIEWFDDTRTTLAWRFPRYNNEIKNGAQLIVREGQKAVFVYRGRLADTFGPGNYELTTENLPILSTIQGWKHGFKSPFRSEVYFINTRPVTELRWGTPNPITIRDPDFKMVQVRANGMCVVRVADPAIFLREVIGTDSNVNVDEISELLRRIIAQAFSDMILQTGVGVIDLQGKVGELSQKLKAFVQERVDDEYGLGIEDILLNVSLPDEITAAMTRGVARGVEEQGFLNQVDDMQRYQQGKLGEAMVAGANNPGGSSVGDFLGAGMGMALGQQMGGAVAGPRQAGPAPAAAPPPLPTATQYHVEQNGQAGGPYTAAQLQQYIAGGAVTRQTLVWAANMAGWTAAGQVPELATLFPAVPPPLPPRMPPA